MTRRGAVAAVVDAIEAGRVLHAEHPDFGGVLTVGPCRAAVGGAGWATIHHGGREDVGDEHESACAAARSFVFQVGKRSALAALDGEVRP